jgi:Trk K+ transport system NAD-binding subunit
MSGMSDVLFLALRRLRAPLITLIAVYAISVAGLALIPGVDADGNPRSMSIFHAFYVMSYTATTIGFGELPHAFNDAQRMWVIFSIYLSVTGWAYTLGSVIALVNNVAFRALLARAIFMWRVRRIAEPFYILCGYGQSGSRLARALDRMGHSLVVVEPQAERIDRVALQDFSTPPLCLNADARLADVLSDCGIRHPHCVGLIALAGDDPVNQAIAIGARVLNPAVQIVARAKSSVAVVNLESFGGVQVINPFETFAFNLELALRAPEVLQVEEWLTASPGSPCPPCLRPPHGRWLLVGFGRFGHEIAKVLDRQKIEWKAFDPGLPDDTDRRLQHGDYIENILRDRNVEDADVLVAGADVDAVNLGATTLARRVKPDIFVVIRQNHAQDRALIEAANADIQFVQSSLMVHECLQLIVTPTLGRFIGHLRGSDVAIARAAIERVRAEVGDGAPRPWTIVCDVLQPGMFSALFQYGGEPFTIRHLVTDPMSRQERMRASVLMLERSGTPQFLPGDDVALKPGDRLLFVGDDVARRLQQRYLDEPSTVEWVRSGSEPPRGLLFRWWRQRRMKREG